MNILINLKKQAEIMFCGEETTIILHQYDEVDTIFNTDVCTPYFKDIYKDLKNRSNEPDKGIN